MSRKNLVASFIAALSLFYFLFLLFSSSCQSTTEKIGAEKNTFVGDQACASCHQTEFNQWKTSHHFHAMEKATPQSVRANWAGEIMIDGVDYDFETALSEKDSLEYYVSITDIGGKVFNLQVEYTFGWYPLQQYLVKSNSGKIQVLRICWDVEKKKWFHQRSGEKILPDDWLHWSRGAGNWNTVCASCHSTNVLANYYEPADSFATTFSSINVSCEACHGAGKNHVDFVQSYEYKNGGKEKGGYLSLGKNSTQKQLLDACGPCHARRVQLGDWKHSGSTHSGFIFEAPSGEHYQADGQIKDEDYELIPFMFSKMYSKGVMCTNCHNPHTAQIKIAGNALCAQCHAPKTFDTPTHYHHEINSAGSLCINCHMPQKTYMEIHVRHDHSFRIPRPDQMVKSGVPNTCNSCHSNKSAAWALAAVNSWFPSMDSARFSDALLSSDTTFSRKSILQFFEKTNPQNSPAILSFFLSDQKALNRISKNQLDQLNRNSSSPILLTSLASAYSQLSPDSVFQKEQLLRLFCSTDKSVRVSAFASALNLFSVSSAIWDGIRMRFAELEYFSALLYQSSEPIGQFQLGEYYYWKKNLSSAIAHYEKAIAMDNKLQGVRLKMSIVYDAMNKPDSSLKILLAEERLTPASSRTEYFLALAYSEFDDLLNAEVHLKKAISLPGADANTYSTLSKLYMFLRENDKACETMALAISLFPNNSSLLKEAISYAVPSNKMAFANSCFVRLGKISPNDPDLTKLKSFIHENK